MFEPPRCTNKRCPLHLDPPEGRFYILCGTYQPKCRNTPIQRFRCRQCRRSFSRQTFRHDYRDHRPEVNSRLLLLLTSGVGLRQAGRLLDLDICSVQHKLRKIAKTCWRMHGNLCPRVPAERTYLMDEEETYETASIRPVTMPVLIERESWFLVDVDTAPIRRLAPEGTARRRRQEREEQENGKRPDQSLVCVRRLLERFAKRLPEGRAILQTDQKSSYATLARELFGDRLEHETTSSKRHRGVHNPLFPINTTLAMSRDNLGRLRRKSWLVSKKRQYLRAHAGLFVAYRNYIRHRFNRDKEQRSPAQVLGLASRRFEAPEVLAWRQDWRQNSIHPTSHSGQSTVAAIAQRILATAAGP